MQTFRNKAGLISSAGHWYMKDGDSVWERSRRRAGYRHRANEKSNSLFAFSIRPSQTALTTSVSLDGRLGLHNERAAGSSSLHSLNFLDGSLRRHVALTLDQHCVSLLSAILPPTQSILEAVHLCILRLRDRLAANVAACIGTVLPSG